METEIHFPWFNSHYSANACLTPLCALHGLAITTVEGIGDSSDINDQGQKKRRLHGILCFICITCLFFLYGCIFFLTSIAAVQERLAKAHASQCGENLKNSTI